MLSRRRAGSGCRRVSWLLVLIDPDAVGRGFRTLRDGDENYSDHIMQYLFEWLCNLFNYG